MTLRLHVAIFAIVSVLGAGYALAQDAEWKRVKTTSADLAVHGGKLISSSGHSWPDGRQAITTFWRGGDGSLDRYTRCISYFNADMQKTGELFESPNSG